MSRVARAIRAPLRVGMELVALRQRRSFGLDGLDLKLLEFLPLRKGFFVEAGANDGLRQSNTAYLERYRGWRGLLVEPIPELASSCRRNRPRSTVEQCALVPFDFAGATVEMTYCNLMSLVRGARGSQAAETAHLERGQRHLAPGEHTYSVVVPARSLTEVLECHRVTRIDLLSLDIEGFEAQALRGLDFERYRPVHILVEANDPASIQALLDPYYELKAHLSHHDRLYVSRSAA